jgi:energy-coupling factor transporter ATP-binding protein EcfA2
VKLRFYNDEPNMFEALFFIGSQGWKGFRRSVALSRTLRRIYENGGLVKIEESGEDKVMTYPYTEISQDDFNLHLEMHMIPGQTQSDWERKLDAFGHALGADLVKTSIKRGVVEITVQHTQMNVNEVIYKTDDLHDISIGYQSGGILKWNFDKHPHALIVGMTGTGKSTFVRNLLAQFREDWTLKIVDGKYVEFNFMSDLGYDVATSHEDFLGYVEDAQNELDGRFRKLQDSKKNNYKDLGMNPYFLLCDEFIFLAEELPAKPKKPGEKSERDQLFAKLRDISLRGRAAGVFLILILQRPDSSFMPTIVRDNLMCKVVLGGSETALEMAFGSEHKKLAHLDQGQGYCMIDDLATFSFPNYEQDEFVSDMKVRTRASAKTMADSKKVVDMYKRNVTEISNEMTGTSLRG